jgi:hypothetical protein
MRRAGRQLMSSVRSPLPPRPRVDDHYLLRVASRLTDRDRVLTRLLHEHRVFTSAQVHDISFDSYRRAQEWLEVLYALGARSRRHQPVTRLSTFATRIASLAQAIYPRNVVVTVAYGSLVTGLSPAVGRF